MTGRHYADPVGTRAHVMRSAHPDPVQVTEQTLSMEEAQRHADSLNQNDQDDINKYGEVQN